MALVRFLSLAASRFLSLAASVFSCICLFIRNLKNKLENIGVYISMVIASFLMERSRKTKLTKSAEDQLEEPFQKQAKLKFRGNVKKWPQKTVNENETLVSLNLESHCSVDGCRQQVGELNICDVQELILFAVLGGGKKVKPKWITFHSKKDITKVVFILVSGVGENDFSKHSSYFTNLKSLFALRFSVSCLGTRWNVEEPYKTLMRVSLPNQEINRRKWKSKPIISEGTYTQVETFTSDPSQYLLTQEQLVANCFPSKDDLKDNKEYVSLKKRISGNRQQGKVPLRAIDCEMCLTSKGKELTRISVVGEDGELLYDSLVVPDNPIIDYLTKYSGITEETLKGVNTTLKDVQKNLLALFPQNVILVGHSLDFDLRALKLCHDKIIDTSILYRRTDKDWPGKHYLKPALRHLAYTFLNKKIQRGEGGHCSIEDARTCMELVQLKIKNGPEFGIPKKVGQTERLMDLLERSKGRPNSCSLLDSPSLVSMFAAPTTHALPCVSDSEAVTRAEAQIKKSDFVWIHLHDADAVCHEEQQNNENKSSSSTFQETLRGVDDNIKKIASFSPSNCLVSVLFGCANLSEVKRMKNMESSPSIDLEKAVKEAKRGLMFVQLT